MPHAFLDQLVALFVFAAIGAFTPGPNNVMLLASGVNHGFRRTIPHIAGVTFGFPVMTLGVALGLGWVFETQPWLHVAIEIVGVAYLLWLSAKIAFQPVERGIGVVTTDAKPLTALQAAAFQWVNVKGWIMAVSGVSVYVPDGLGPLAGALVLSGVFFVTGIGSASTWAAFGTIIARHLGEPRRLRIFNRTMGLALVASLWPAAVDFVHWLGR